MDNFQTYAKFLETIPDAAIIIDDNNTIVVANRQAEAMFGYTFYSLQEQSLDVLLPPQHVANHSQHVRKFFANPSQRSMGQGVELTGRRRNGEIFAIDIMISSLELDGKAHAVAIVRDNSRRFQAEKKIRLELEHQRQQALTDSLTGLANRRAFALALQNHLAQLESHQRNFSIAYLDLDNFKEVNDTAGHQAGDRLLQIFGDFINKLCRSRDLIARVGGDEFAIILAESNEAQSQIALTRICRRVVGLFQKESWPVTVSIGWVFCNDLSADITPDELMKLADHAMYRAKRRGKNSIAQGDLSELQKAITRR